MLGFPQHLYLIFCTSLEQSQCARGMGRSNFNLAEIIFRTEEKSRTAHGEGREITTN